MTEDLEPLSMRDVVAMMRYNARDGGRKMNRDEALTTPLTPEQVKKVHTAVYTEINDPGLTTDDGQPHGLGFKGWTLLIARLLWTINQQHGQIVRAQQALADVQKALWIPPDQGTALRKAREERDDA